MWWLIPMGINMVIAVLMLREGLKVDDENNANNKLIKEGSQSALRHFYDVEENEDEESGITMDELKPRPFCGAQAEVYETPSGRYTIVARHDDCCCFSNLLWGCGFETEEEAIGAWNRRVYQ